MQKATAVANSWQQAARSGQNTLPAAGCRRPTAPALFAFCILHFALLGGTGCAKAPPAVLTTPPFDSTRQLQTDLQAALAMPGVQRATWGIAVQSLATNERLFDLNARTLMVPASVAKLVSLATAVEAVGWGY